MTVNIAITFEELNRADMISIASPIPLNMFDPRSPSFSDEEKRRILHDTYKRRIVADGLETGHLIPTENGYIFKSKQRFPSFAGFVFEAYLVDKFNQCRSSRLRAYQWATERSEGWSTKDFEEYKAVGTGLITTKNEYLTFYEPQSNADIIFLRKNPLRNDIMEPALIHNQHVQAAIQVKCIKSGFREEIINKVLSGKYLRVITMLSDEHGRSSWVVCHNILGNMHRSGAITTADYAYAIGRIQGPEYFNIDQYDVDNYYSYIHQWYQGYEPITKNIEEAVGLEITGYKFENNVLVPI